MTPFALIDRASSSRRASSVRDAAGSGSARAGRCRPRGRGRRRRRRRARRRIRALRPLPSAGRFSAMVVFSAWQARCAARGVAREHFAREREVRLGAARFHVVEDHRHAVARRFAEAHVARDDGVEDLLLEELAHVARHLLARGSCARRTSSAATPSMSSAGLSAARTRLQRGDEIREALEREVLAVQRNEHRVGGDERVEREQAERRRAVDEDVVEAIAERRDDAAEARFAARASGRVRFRRR